MRHLPTFAMILLGSVAAGCAASEPPPKAVSHDQSSYMPAEYVEMSFDGKQEDEAPKPVATPTPRAADKPNVATGQKRGLFGIAKKTKD